jgi:tRNA(fMet)-specific endonuclease VapC
LTPYLLDTNAWIEYLRGRNQNLRQHVAAVRPRDIRLCSVVVGELYHGAYKSSHCRDDLKLVDGLLNSFSSHPYDDLAARRYGEVRALLEAKGTPIGPYDLQIAAIALANQLTLVTHNLSEFSRVPGLTLEDWQI